MVIGSLLIVLSTWLALGLVVACLFGCFVRGVEAPDAMGRRPSRVVVLYMRHAKRAKTILCARTTAQTR